MIGLAEIVILIVVVVVGLALILTTMGGPGG